MENGQTKLALDIHATRYAIYQDLREAVTMFLKEVKFSNEAQANIWMRRAALVSISVPR